MNTDHFDDIEQMLKPQCEFKASESLKQNVMAKARQEVCPHSTIRLWPWVAAACVAGFLESLSDRSPADGLCAHL